MEESGWLKTTSYLPTPSCQGSVFSERGTLRIISIRERSLGQGAFRRAGVGWVKIEIVFSRLLDERRERRIHHRISNHPFQPGGHQMVVQWCSVQAGLDVKSPLVANDPDNGRGIRSFWK